MKRRRFLQNLGAGLAIGFPTVVPASVFARNDRIAPNDRIVMGLIGCGGMGRGDMRGLIDKAGTKFVAVCDVDTRQSDGAKEDIDKKYGNRDCRVYRDYREYLAKEKLDATVIALPDHWHAIISVAAVRKGFDVYGEKPLARTHAESRAIVEAVKKYGTVWQTGSQQRSDERFRRAAELVINDRLGKVEYVEVGLPDGDPKIMPQKLIDVPEELDWNMWLGPAPWRPFMDFGNGGPHWNWRWIMDYSGGQLTDWAGHHIDCAHWGLGLDYTGPVEIEGQGEYYRDGLYDVPYKYKFTCKYKSGLNLLVASRSQLPHGQGITWYGERGKLHVHRGANWAEPKSILAEKIGPDEKRLYRSTDHRQNFIDCIRTRSLTVAPAEVAHRSISVAFLGEIAMLAGRKIKWDPDNERIIGDPNAERYLARAFRSPWHI